MITFTFYSKLRSKQWYHTSCTNLSMIIFNNNRKITLTVQMTPVKKGWKKYSICRAMHLCLRVLTSYFLTLLWEQWSRCSSVLVFKLVWVFFVEQSECPKISQIPQYQPNISISAKYHNISQLSQYQPNITISAKYHYIIQISQHQPNITI